MRGSFEQVLAADHVAQRLELLVADRADEQLLSVSEGEHVVDAPGGDARGHGRGRLAGHRELLHVLAAKECAVLEEGALHLLASSGALPFQDRRQHADSAEHAAHDVVDRVPARSGRPPDRSCRRVRPSSGPPRPVQAGSRRARQEALVRDVDQVRDWPTSSRSRGRTSPSCRAGSFPAGRRTGRSARPHSPGPRGVLMSRTTLILLRLKLRKKPIPSRAACASCRHRAARS